MWNCTSTSPHLRALALYLQGHRLADSLRVVGHVGVHEDHMRPRYDPQPIHVGCSKAHFARPRQNPHNLLPV